MKFGAPCPKSNQTKWRLPVLLVWCLAMGGVSFGSQVSLLDKIAEAERALSRGDNQTAIATWLEAAKQLELAGRRADEAEILINVAEAYQDLGLYSSALEVLTTAKRAQSQQQSATYVKILGTSGAVLLGMRDIEKADIDLTVALSLARQLDETNVSAFIQNNLGNLYAAKQQERNAIAAYSESADIARANGLYSLEARALTNIATLWCRNGKFTNCESVQKEALQVIRSLVDSHDKANLLVTTGLNAMTLLDRFPERRADLIVSAHSILSEASSVSELVGDLRVASYALGYLGNLYEKEHRLQDALRLTRKAVSYADKTNAPESLYRWQWQAGRLLQALQSTDEALRAYRGSVATLQNIRQEFPGAYAGAATAFRESVGVAYFEMIDLLMRRASSLPPERAKAYLTEARDTLEEFKLAELRDYFRDDCVDAYLARASTVEKLAEDVAVIYPISLRDRLELLVQLPSGLERIPVPVSEQSLTAEVRRFRELVQQSDTNLYRAPAQQLYKWLIEPMHGLLKSASKVNTLVFVPDGPLRTIPIAALWNGTEFLAQQFAVAVTPSFRLSDPRPLKRERIKVLLMGLTQSVRNVGLAGPEDFAPLPGVEAELNAINDVYPGGTLLRDESFRLSNVEAELAKTEFSVVHVASHAAFASNVSDSFLLTYNEKFSPDELGRLIGRFRLRETPIELLTLSACESAAGDDRAALGLAGVAVKAGAKSALATLWVVDDYASADLVSSFYRNLRNDTLSKAKALQEAQKELWKASSLYTHPYYWSSFVLINNWL